mgnify:CR=1 FL=1
MFLDIKFNFFELICLAFVSAFVISYLFIPTIVRMSKFKKLFDHIDERKIHTNAVPRLGGIAVFAGFFISSMLFVSFQFINDLNAFLVGTIILLFIGVKDDILIISPITKLIGQFIAASIAVIFSKTLISNFYGFFNIFQINYFFAVIITIFFYVFIINAFNFIDGIDGLAASLGIIASFSIGIWFCLSGFYYMAIISAAFIAALLAFLRFNIFSLKNKVFLGDTGSMLIGFTVAFLSIKFLNLNLFLVKDAHFFILPAPALVFAVMVMPIFDLVRIVIVRVVRNKKPYAPDNFHLHHIFYKLGLTHIQITIIYSTYSILFIILSYFLSKCFSIRRLLLIEIIITLFVSFIPEYIYFLKSRKKMN